MTLEPIQKSSEPLITHNEIDCGRRGNYGFELYALPEGTLLLLEYWGNWKGYAAETQHPPEIANADLNEIHLTLHNPTPELESIIKRLIKNIPHEDKKRKK